MALDDIKKINDEINKLRAELGKRPLAPFDIAKLEEAKALLSGLQAEVREMGNDLDYIYKSFKDSVNELSKQDRYLSDSRKSLNGISNIAKQISDYRKGEISLDEKTLQNLQKKAKAQFDELDRIKKVGNLSKTNRGEIQKALKDQDDFKKAIDETIEKQKEVNKEIGLVGTGIEGISKGLSKMGFGNLSQPLTEAIEKTKHARLQQKLNNEEIQRAKTQLEGINDKRTKSARLLKSEIEKYEKINAELSTQTSKYKNIGKALTDQLTKANLIDFAIGQMVDALIKADTQTGQLAKAFGTSYSEAASLRNELNTVANLSGDINITTGALQESLIAVNKEFGTATMFSGEILKDFTNMTKVMGYTNEAASKLSKITVATGTDLSDNTAQILGTAAAFNVTNGLALNEKEIVEGVAKASAATTVSLGMQTKAISGAVLEAKKLGLELEQVEGIAESLLNFESSISNELEAELLTGRALNLEQARYLALTNDIGGVAKEIARQGITSAEFGKMNAIQQKSLAEAVGLTKEELAQSLMTQEALTNINVKDAEAAKEKFDKLVEQYGYEKAVKELGDEKYGQQLKSQSVQDRFNASVEKLKEIFVSIAGPVLQIVSPFMDLVTTILPLVNIALTPIVFIFKGIAEAVQGFVNLIHGDLKNGLEGVLQIAQSISVVWGGIILGAKLLGKETLKNITLQGTLGSLLKADFWKSVGTSIAKMWGSIVGFLGPFGIPVAMAAATGLAGLAYSFFSKGDDIMSPGGNTSGYGERTLFGPEGAIQLNNKDTVIAGTNLFGNTAQSTSPSISVNTAPLANEMQAGTNLFGNTAQSTSPSISVNITPLVNEMQAVKAVLVQMLNKDSNVYLDGAKVGKGVAMASSKIG